MAGPRVLVWVRAAEAPLGLLVLSVEDALAAL